MLVLLDVLIALLPIIQMDKHVSEVVLKVCSLFLAHLILLFDLHSLRLRLSHLSCCNLISLILSLSLHRVMLLCCILACVGEGCLHHLWLHLAPIVLLLLLLHHLLVLGLILLLMSICLFHVIHVLLMSFKNIDVNLQVITIVLILIHALIQVVLFFLLAFFFFLFLILVLFNGVPILLLLLLARIGGLFGLWVGLLAWWVGCLCALLWGLRVWPLLINCTMHCFSVLYAERRCYLNYACIVIVDFVLFERLSRCCGIGVLICCCVEVLLLLCVWGLT